ncbi:conserved oligomeric Golgi complex component [Haplosporangium sp. Z 767]|nr:conserved oligomeric Golgi complex component [Haplosporangium sp. Z 767]
MIADKPAPHGIEVESNGYSSNNLNTNNHTSHTATSTTTSTDQDALFDLIYQQVPPPKRELLSTVWSKDYLNRLTSLPARALHSEPEKLREEQLKVEKNMSELAFRDYKAFILVKDCKQDVQSTFGILGQHLDHFQETIPQFVETLSGFSAKVAPILERQHVFSSILATHSQLLEVLEIPLLMETCVRNGYYNEALELASHVQRLVLRYPGIGIIEDIELKVAQGKEMMLVQLLAQLREPIKLPVALRIVGFLRRIGSFKGQLEMAEDEEHHGFITAAGAKSKGGSTTLSASYASSTAPTSTSVSAIEDETPLKMLFLKSRGLYMNVQLSKIVHHKGDSFGYLKKYIDVTRECLFDIMTYYKSIFGNMDHYAGFSSSSASLDYRGYGAGAGSGDGGKDSTLHQQPQSPYYQKLHCWTTDNLLADFITYRTQTLLHVLKTHIPQIHDTSALSSVLTQLMYFGANLAKIGFDLRYLVTSLFEEAMIRIVGGAFQRGADEFLDSLGGENRNHPDWLLPSQWMLGGTGRAPTSSSSPLPSSTSPVFGRTSNTDGSSSSSSLSPQTCLMDYPALAYLTNAYLTALNSLRLLAPLSLAIPLREILVDSLMRVDMALEEYDRFVFGERSSAFRSTLLSSRPAAPAPTAGHIADQSERDPGFKMQGMEGSVILNEQKIMDGFVIVYKRAVQDYILKCFDEGIYGGLIHVELTQDLNNEEEIEAEADIEMKSEEMKSKESKPETELVGNEIQLAEVASGISSEAPTWTEVENVEAPEQPQGEDAPSDAPHKSELSAPSSTSS